MPEYVDIVMRSKNEGRYLAQTIEAVRAQEGQWQGRITAIDSGSTDGSLEIMRGKGVERLIQIERYVAGQVLNQGMRETGSAWVVYLNADATPADSKWLAELMQKALETPRAGAAFSRQIPRPDCWAVHAHDYDRCFGLERESRSWGHFFSMVSSVVNRAAWLEQPFRDDLRYAEDDEWSRRLIANGWAAPYAEGSVAIHSHNYKLREAYKRSYGDTFALAATSSTPPRNYNYHYTVGVGALRDAMRDWSWCAREGRRREWFQTLGMRVAQRLGKRDGYRAGWVHYGRTTP